MTRAKDKIEVLFVDDEIYHDDVKKESMIMEMLEADGDISVTPAVNGTQALQHLNEGSFDIIVLDVMMATGDGIDREKSKNGVETGYELLRIIRSTLKLMTPVIIYTNYAKILSDEELEKLSVSEYIAKSIKMKDMAELFRFHSGRSPQ